MMNSTYRSTVRIELKRDRNYTGIMTVRTFKCCSPKSYYASYATKTSQWSRSVLAQQFWERKLARRRHAVWYDALQNNTVLRNNHRRSQDFVWGALFLTKKVAWRPFFLNTRPNLTRPAKTVLKINSCSSWGCTSCPSGCTYTFSL